MTEKQKFVMESVREVFFKKYGSHIPDENMEESYFDENFEKQVKFFREMWDKTQQIPE